MFDYYPNSQLYQTEDSKQKIIFTTLLKYCVDISSGLSYDSLIEKDASDAKTYQLYLIDSVVEAAFTKNKIKTYRALLSEKIKTLFDPEQTSRNVLCSILQHEFSIQIKGRTDGTIDSYYNLPSIENGLTCEGKKDKELIFSLFNDYQKELNSVQYFDVDDAVMEAMSKLNAPLWRRERSVSGFDYIFVDEMHLFNLNEQSIFHFLTKDITQRNIPICFALDYSQAVGDRGKTELDYIEKAFGENVQSIKYNTVFRNSPQIANFCASIAASGTLMFNEYFSNPYNNKVQTNFTQNDEAKSKTPILYMYNDDDSMISSLQDHISAIQRDLHCRLSEIAIISFEPSIFEKGKLDTLSEKGEYSFSLLNDTGKLDMHNCIVAQPYNINGLEFQAVILLGVDEGRLPQTAGVGDISQNYLRYSAYNLLYLSASRAKYRLDILGNSLHGISSCLLHSIEACYLEVNHEK